MNDSQPLSKAGLNRWPLTTKNRLMISGQRHSVWFAARCSGNAFVIAPTTMGESFSGKEMTVGDTRSLLGRILVVVAHQDDETACSVLLQRAGEARVVFATNGAPATEFFWHRYGRVSNMRP
jgi:hypothetical protein